MKKGNLIIGLLVFLIALVAIASKWEIRSSQAYAGARLDDDYTAGTIDLSDSSAQYTLPGVSGKSYYIVKAHGNRAYVTCGANPTATTAADGYTFSVGDGDQTPPLPLTGPKCAHIAGSAAGRIEFLHFSVALD